MTRTRTRTSTIHFPNGSSRIINPLGRDWGFRPDKRSAKANRRTIADAIVAKVITRPVPVRQALLAAMADDLTATAKAAGVASNPDKAVNVIKQAVNIRLEGLRQEARKSA